MTINHSTTSLIERARQAAQSLFDQNKDAPFLYHNLHHTQKVVHAADEIARHYALSDEDYLVVMVSAWFHDVGYFEDTNHHEEKGVVVAQRFLEQEKTAQVVIDRVSNCIMATRMPQRPQNLVEQILCDADLFHLGTEEFDKSNRMIRQECNVLFRKHVSKRDWGKKAIQLLESHHYHTDYAKKILNAGKEKNKEVLEAKISTDQDYVENETEQGYKNHHMKKEKNMKKNKKPKRGIETMFRITSNNHQRLSDMADSKASIMITVNSIILSVLLSVLLRKLEENPALTIPVVLLLSVNVVTIIFSVLATRPHVSPGVFTQKEVEEKKVNLLFFGNFYKMNLKEYTSSMMQMMDDSEYLYKSLIKDVYSQGVVLGRKYKLLRSAYNVFMFGIVASVVAFLIATLLS